LNRTEVSFDGIEGSVDLIGVGDVALDSKKL
jgi:hypothetical protein